MPKFVTVHYDKRDGYERTSESVRGEAHQQDLCLTEEGALVGIAGSPVQVRNAEVKGVTARHGTFMQVELTVAGFAIIDASDLEEAIAKVSHIPCAVAQGAIEVKPLKTAGQSLPIQHKEVT